MARRKASSGHSPIGPPSISNSPAGASHNRATSAASVVLPLPVGPIIASVEPAGIFKFMLLSMGRLEFALAPVPLPAIALLEGALFTDVPLLAAAPVFPSPDNIVGEETVRLQ